MSEDDEHELKIELNEEMLKPILYIGDLNFSSKTLKSLSCHPHLTKFKFHNRNPEDLKHFEYLYIKLLDSDNRKYVKHYLKQFKASGWTIITIYKSKRKRHEKQVLPVWCEEIQPDFCMSHHAVAKCDGLDLVQTLERLKTLGEDVRSSFDNPIKLQNIESIWHKIKALFKKK